MKGRWDEAEHPRARDGRFGDKVGSVGAAVSVTSRSGNGAPVTERRKAAPPADAAIVTSRSRNGAPVTERRPANPGEVPAELVGALRAPTAFRGNHGHGGTPNDTVLEAIAHRQGMDGPPAIVDAADIDKAIAAGMPEMMRAVRKPRDDDNFRTGPYYGGLGTQGSGTYVSWRPADFDPEAEARRDFLGDDVAGRSDEELLAAGEIDDEDLRMLRRFVARQAPKNRDRMFDITSSYGDTVSRMALKPGTKIADFERDVLPAQRTYLAELRKQQDANPSEDLALWITAMQDPGRFAAHHGIPAYYGRVPGEMIVLDRSAVLVQRDRLAPRA